ncbi:prolactin-releasing peptide [Nothoprocta perdicaria]|uniref:Prolactin releasing hormone n=1 Tax=Nothoprocta perdicaria TaxID=30464 RepID=A0A8C6ZKW4_NOTPE|nr:prolactin-releasing peptide [Nothoprocta perdicaria]
MKVAAACLAALLLAGLALRDAEGRPEQHSMEIRNPDIDPSWYTGRGIRPVGRFGRRRAPGAAEPAHGWARPLRRPAPEQPST